MALGAHLQSEDTPLLQAGLNADRAALVRMALINTLGGTEDLLPPSLMSDQPTVAGIVSVLQQNLSANSGVSIRASESSPSAEVAAETTLQGAIHHSNARRTVCFTDCVSRLPQPLKGICGSGSCDGEGEFSQWLRPSASGTWAASDCGDGVRALPCSRSDAADEQLIMSSHAIRFGALIVHVEMFDRGAFGIGPMEAVCMDPQQRVLLEGVQETVVRRRAHSNSAVMVGICNVDYLRLTLRTGATNSHLSTGLAAGVASGRVSFVWGLTGPAGSVDTSCSSSLVAAHLGLGAVRNGSCEGSVLGGVNLTLAPQATVLLNNRGVLAEDGRCKVFDSSADGYGRGEGAVVVYACTEGQAMGDVLARDGASAVSQDGRSSALSAPNGEAQARCLTAGLWPMRRSFLQLPFFL